MQLVVFSSDYAQSVGALLHTISRCRSVFQSSSGCGSDITMRECGRSGGVMSIGGGCSGSGVMSICGGCSGILYSWGLIAISRCWIAVSRSVIARSRRSVGDAMRESRCRMRQSQCGCRVTMTNGGCRGSVRMRGVGGRRGISMSDGRSGSDDMTLLFAIAFFYVSRFVIAVRKQEYICARVQKKHTRVQKNV